MALLIAPSLVGRLLLGAKLAAAFTPIARVTGHERTRQWPFSHKGVWLQSAAGILRMQEAGNSTCAFDA